MSRARPPLAILALAAILAAGLLARAARGGEAPGERISPAQRAATLGFASTVAPGDRQWVLAAIDRVRPEARRLIDEVDGLVTIETVPQAPYSGVTRPQPDGTFIVGLNVGALDGVRYRDRTTTVVHELGHVIDFTLIDDSLDAELDRGIPAGSRCEVRDGIGMGGCAAPEERLADTFAKWALNGAVSAVGAGYGLATPASLEDWGRPLGALAASLPAQ